MADDSGTGLPASIETAWGLRERPSKGPRPGLSLERIVEAAVRVAAADGLPAVSMSKVAAELGTSAMALYRYVKAKDELLLLMVDAAVGPPPAPPERPGWRAGLEHWTWAYVAALRRHPWMLRVPITGPPVTPNMLAWLESGLTAMRGTRLTEVQKMSVMLLLSGLVRHDATLSLSLAEAAAARSPGLVTMQSYGALVRRLTDPALFPELHTVVDAGVLDGPDGPDDELEFGLATVLDGVAALMRRQGAADAG
ncbi:TetR/AcrR family transcriptional regulator [Streptomyces capparidis]